MATMSHQPPVTAPRPWWIEARDMWASLTISVIWLSVLFTAVFGADITSIQVDNTTTVPSAVVVAFFAAVGSWAMAKYGFARRSDS